MTRAKVHKKDISGSDNKTEKTVLWHIAFWGLAVLLFLPPFFRGLFFATEQRKVLLFALFILGLVCLWKWLRKDYAVLAHPMDYFVLALPVVYIISAFNSINSGLAVDEIVKTILYFTVYWVVAQLISKQTDTQTLISVIYGSAVFIGLAGLMTATNIVNIKDGFQVDRLASSLQYPNGLAALMVMVLPVGVYLWCKVLLSSRAEGKRGDYKLKELALYIIGMGNYLAAVVIVDTKSQGGFSIFLLSILLIAFMVPKRYRSIIIWHFTAISLVAIPAGYLFIKSTLEKHYAEAWIILALFFLPLLLFQLAYKKYILYILQSPILVRKVNITAIVLLLVTVVGGYITQASKFTKTINEIKLYSLVDRMDIIRDAFVMMRERLIIGWGGGAWNEAYQYFKNFGITTSQVHSHYIQTTIETGLIGLFIVIGIWVAFIITGYQTYKKSEDDTKLLLSMLMVPAIALGIHAMVDFTFSLSSISIFLYSYMALVRNSAFDISTWEKDKKLVLSKTPIVITILAGILAFLFVSCIISAESYSKQAQEYYVKRNFAGAIILTEKASTLDPFRSEYKDMLSELYAYQGNKEVSRSYTDKALKISQYGPSHRINAAKTALFRGDNEEAVKYVEEAIRLGPWELVYYEFAAQIYKALGLAELKNNNITKANEYFIEAVKIPERINIKTNSFVSNRWSKPLKLVVSDKIMLSVGACYTLMHNYDEAYRIILSVVKSGNQDVKGEAYIWMSLLLEKRGDITGSEAYLNSAQKISSDYGKMYIDLKILINK